MIIIVIILVLLEIPTSYGMGLIFKKINLDFKKGIIPFYNKIILIKKYNLPQYHLMLIFIPIVGLYTNFIIYTKILNKKDFNYILKLTLLPFIYNIKLGKENIQKKENIENYFEDQKKLYSKEQIKEQIKQDEYTWHMKPEIKSDTIYKASRNTLSAKVNLNINSNNKIIDKKPTKKTKENTITCPKCGATLPEETEICFVCGTKI